MRATTPCVFVLVLAGPGPALACSEADAKKQTAAHAEISAFCARSKRGCDFAARPPSPLNANEKKDASLAWVVTASQIHSFDEQGRPRFMPEGFMFARVSKACTVTAVTGSVPRPPPP